VIEYGLRDAGCQRIRGGGLGIFELLPGRGAALTGVCGVGVTFAVNALGSFPILLGGMKSKADLLAGCCNRQEIHRLLSFRKESGSDAGSLKAKAWKEGDDWIIDGDKKWTTTQTQRKSIPSLQIRIRKGTRGISAFVVEKGWDGFTIGKERQNGIRCVPVHETHFRLPVSSKSLLGKEGMASCWRCRPWIALARVCSPGPRLSTRRIGTRNGMGSESQAVGQNLLSFQALQSCLPITPLKSKQQDNSCTLRRGGRYGRKVFPSYRAMAKLYASDVAMKVTTDAVQIFGGYG